MVMAESGQSYHHDLKSAQTTFVLEHVQLFLPNLALRLFLTDISSLQPAWVH